MPEDLVLDPLDALQIRWSGTRGVRQGSRGLCGALVPGRETSNVFHRLARLSRTPRAGAPRHGSLRDLDAPDLDPQRSFLNNKGLRRLKVAPGEDFSVCTRSGPGQA